jgi:hypothetical protein
MRVFLVFIADAIEAAKKSATKSDELISNSEEQ